MKALPVILVSALLGGTFGFTMARTNGVPQAAIHLTSGKTAGPSFDSSVPVARIEEPEFDFVVMQRGARRSHDFVVKNEGEAPLQLTAGETSCKCTSFEVSRESVPPGGERTVTLEWVAKSLPGPFRQTAQLGTNDPLRPTIQLAVDGDVVAPAGLDPDSFNLGEFHTGKEASASVLFFSTKNEDLQVEATGPQDESVSDWFDVKVTRVEKSALPVPNAVAAYSVALTAKPGLPVGQVMQWVTLSTNQADSDGLEIPVYGRVVGDITAHGAGWNEQQGVLHLGMVRQQEGIKRRLILSVKGEHSADTRFEISGVEPPALQVSLGETTNRSDDVYHTFLTVEVPPGTRQMIHLNNAQGEDGLIRLKTTHPSSTEMLLRVRFAVVQ